MQEFQVKFISRVATAEWKAWIQHVAPLSDAMTLNSTKGTIQTWFAGSQILKEYNLSKEHLCIARGTHRATATGDIGGTPAYTATYQMNASPSPRTASLVYTTRRQNQYTSASWVYPKASRGKGNTNPNIPNIRQNLDVGSARTSCYCHQIIPPSGEI